MYVYIYYIYTYIIHSQFNLIILDLSFANAFEGGVRQRDTTLVSEQRLGFIFRSFDSISNHDYTA